MKTLFLTSAIREVISDIARKIPTSKKLLFITTASEGEVMTRPWLQEDKDECTRVGFQVVDFTITGKNATDIRVAVDSSDVICMEGGNTFYLLEQLQKTDSREVFIHAIEQGKPYIGSSAGSVICSPDILVTADVEKAASSLLQSHEGFGVVDFYVFVHTNREKYAKRVAEYALRFDHRKNEKVILLQDSQYVHVQGETYTIVSLDR